MKTLLAAFQFLTIVPFPSRFSCGEKELSRSPAFFPVIGLVLGAVLACADRGISRLVPVLPASVITVIALFSVSGGLHMDGLADTADGFFSSRRRERMLEIMKDSRSGPMGVMAVVSVIVLKCAALASTPTAFRWSVLFLTPLAGRCALVLQMSMLSYARTEGGLASVFSPKRWMIPMAVSVLAAVSFLAAGLAGLTAAAASVAVTFLFSLWCRRKIGGFTGDTLGAACELAELTPALVAASWSLQQ